VFDRSVREAAASFLFCLAATRSEILPRAAERVLAAEITELTENAKELQNGRADERQQKNELPFFRSTVLPLSPPTSVFSVLFVARTPIPILSISPKNREPQVPSPEPPEKPVAFEITCRLPEI
jgi:hypothetical protein